MNRVGELRELIWQFIKKENREAPEGCKVTKKEIDKSVVYMEGEHRISGEEDTLFSLFYANYWDIPSFATSLMEHLRKHGWDAEWYNPAYMVAYKRE